MPQLLVIMMKIEVHNKKFKLLQDVVIIETGKETYIISLMHKHKLNCYLVAGEAKPILQNQLKEK